MRFVPAPLRPSVLLALGALLLAAACAPDTAERAGSTAHVGPATLSPEARRLNALVDDYQARWLELNPLEATEAGEHRYDDRFGDYLSDAWLADALALEQDSLAALEQLDPSKLQGEERLTYEAFRYGRRLAAEAFRYPSELMPPLHPAGGVPMRFALLGSGAGGQPFRSVRDYERFLLRMDGFATWADLAIVNLRAGVAKGVVLPRSSVERLLPSLDALAAAEPQQSVFWQPIARLPSALRIEDKTRLAQAYHAKLAGVVLPAYRRLHDFLAEEYLGEARESVGYSALPNGEAWYAYLARRASSGRLSPDELHGLGLREVERLRAEVARLAPQFGHGGELRGFLDALRTDERLRYAAPEPLLTAYRTVESRVAAALPPLFPPTPDPGPVVRTLEAFRAGAEPDVVYRPGAPDGSRPGVLYVNTSDLASRRSYLVEANFLHSALPGRHLQASVAYSLTDLPKWRRLAAEPAYVEGWAGYTRTLGSELGLSLDAFGQLGAATAALRSAARLVVDTGLHARGWTRSQAVDYLRANTDLAETEVAAEVERAIAWPGQGLAETPGALRMRASRVRAAQQIGSGFDAREFHAQVLGSGALPLDVLEAKLERWSSARRAAAQ